MCTVEWNLINFLSKCAIKFKRSNSEMKWKQGPHNIASETGEEKRRKKNISNHWAIFSMLRINRNKWPQIIKLSILNLNRKYGTLGTIKKNQNQISPILCDDQAIAIIWTAVSYLTESKYNVEINNFYCRMKKIKLKKSVHTKQIKTKTKL